MDFSFCMATSVFLLGNGATLWPRLVLPSVMVPSSCLVIIVGMADCVSFWSMKPKGRDLGLGKNF